MPQFNVCDFNCSNKNPNLLKVIKNKEGEHRQCLNQFKKIHILTTANKN